MRIYPVVVVIFLSTGAWAADGEATCLESDGSAIEEAIDRAIEWQGRWFESIVALEPYAVGVASEMVVVREADGLYASMKWEGKVVSFSLGCDPDGTVRAVGYPIRFSRGSGFQFGAVDLQSGTSRGLLDATRGGTSGVALVFEYKLPDLSAKPDLRHPGDEALDALIGEVRSKMDEELESCGGNLEAIIPRFDIRDPIVFVRLSGLECDRVLEVHHDVQGRWIARRSYETSEDWKAVGDRISSNEWFRVNL